MSIDLPSVLYTIIAAMVEDIPTYQQLMLVRLGQSLAIPSLTCRSADKVSKRSHKGCLDYKHQILNKYDRIAVLDHENNTPKFYVNTKELLARPIIENSTC